MKKYAFKKILQNHITNNKYNVFIMQIILLDLHKILIFVVLFDLIYKHPRA